MRGISKVFAVIIASMFGAVIGLPQPAMAATSKGAKALVSASGHQKKKSRTFANVRIRRLATETGKKRRTSANKRVRVASKAKQGRKRAERRVKARLANSTVRPAKKSMRRSTALARNKLFPKGKKILGAFINGRSLLDRAGAAESQLVLVGSNQGRRKKKFRTPRAALPARSRRNHFAYRCFIVADTEEPFLPQREPPLEWTPARRGGRD